MTKEELRQAFIEGDKEKVTKLLIAIQETNIQQTDMIIISLLYDFSLEENHNHYQNTLTLLNNIGDDTNYLRTILYGWILCKQYEMMQADDKTLPSTSSDILAPDSSLVDIDPERKTSLETKVETDHSTSHNNNMGISGDVEEFFPIDL